MARTRSAAFAFVALCLIVKGTDARDQVDVASLPVEVMKRLRTVVTPV